MINKYSNKKGILRAIAEPLIGLLAIFVVTNVAPVMNLPFVAKVDSACAQTSPNLTVKLLSIRNVPGQTYSDSTTASPGDAVFFQIEAHNTIEGSTADDATLRVDFPSGEGTSFSPVVHFSASNASEVSDSTTVNLTSPGRLVFNSGSVGIHWDPDGDGDFDFDGALANGDSLVTSGVNLGPLHGCNAFIIQMSFSANVVGQEVTPTPTPTVTQPTATPTPTPTPTSAPGPTPTPTPTTPPGPTPTPTPGQVGGQSQTQTQTQNNTQNQTVNQNVTINQTQAERPAVVLGAKAPSIQPKSGPEGTILLSLFGMLPFGAWLRGRRKLW